MIVAIVGVAFLAVGGYVAFVHLAVTAIQSSTSDRVITLIIAVVSVVLGLSALGWAIGLTTWWEKHRAERNKPK